MTSLTDVFSDNLRRTREFVRNPADRKKVPKSPWNSISTSKLIPRLLLNKSEGLKCCSRKNRLRRNLECLLACWPFGQPAGRGRLERSLEPDGKPLA